MTDLLETAVDAHVGVTPPSSERLLSAVHAQLTHDARQQLLEAIGR
jgi:hypothetical protein